MTPKPAAEGEEDEDDDTEEGEVGEEEKAADTVEPEPEEVVIDSKYDHRIAMAFGVLGAAIGAITVNEAECVAKTYPGFWETLKSIGGEVATSAE